MSDTISVSRRVIEEAIWAIDWCVSEHYAPDSSREQAALAALRTALEDNHNG